MEQATERVILASPELIKGLGEWSIPVQVRITEAGMDTSASHEMEARLPVVTDAMVEMILIFAKESAAEGVYLVNEGSIKAGLEAIFRGVNKEGDLE